jgi:hypothetical protein
MGKAVMWFLLAGSALLLALLAGVAFDDAGVRGWNEARHDGRPFDVW